MELYQSIFSKNLFLEMLWTKWENYKN